MFHAVLEAAGRTFPVEAVFLEDVYRIIGYRLVCCQLALSPILYLYAFMRALICLIK